MSAITTTGKLSPMEKGILKTKQVAGEYTPNEWINIFTKLCVYDKKWGKIRNISSWLGIAGIFLTVLSLFLLPSLIGILAVTTSILTIIIGFSLVLYKKKFDLPDEILSENVLPIIKIMEEEMLPAEKLKMRLDLRGFELPEKLFNTSSPSQLGIYDEITHYFYKDHWFDGEAFFADGTKVLWNLSDIARTTKKSKRNSRGKRKTKYKYKHRSLIQLQIAVNEQKYAFAKLKEKSEEGNISTKKSGNFYWMSINKKIKHGEGETFAAINLFDCIASAYARAIPRGARR